jgi:hypothetical protein
LYSLMLVPHYRDVGGKENDFHIDDRAASDIWRKGYITVPSQVSFSPTHVGTRSAIVTAAPISGKSLQYVKGRAPSVSIRKVTVLARSSYNHIHRFNGCCATDDVRTGGSR